jgi:integrase
MSILVVRDVMAKHQKKRIPKLSYSENRNIGFYVAYRDPTTGQPKKHRFGMVDKADAEAAYYTWVSEHLTGKPHKPHKPIPVPSANANPVELAIVEGSLLHVVSGLLTYDESRLRKDGEPRPKGTIGQKQFDSRRTLANSFLTFVNERHGSGAVGRLKVTDLNMEDVEKFNLKLKNDGYSASQVAKSLQVVKAIIDRAGRPEYGLQLLTWNWDSRDAHHGKPEKPVILPTVKQLKLILRKCNEQRTALVWMAIGLGFGQGDLSRARVECFDKDSYDMRRGKTGFDRYGEMPLIVWLSLQRYLTRTPRDPRGLLFVTEQGKPLVHGTTDSVVQWWDELKRSIGSDCDGMNGFYSLRHLGATEFGSRPGCSISDMRRWLGHSASSAVADRYMKPVSPEYKPVVVWVRKCLHEGKADLRLPRVR